MKISSWLAIAFVSPCLASLKEGLIENYANILHATYSDALAEAKTLDDLIGNFADKPDEEQFLKIKNQ